MTNFEAHQQGYEASLRAFDKKLNESIRRHGGARNYQQCTQVLNDMIVYLHSELQYFHTFDEQASSVEYEFDSDVEAFFKQLLGESDHIKFTVIKGGL